MTIHRLSAVRRESTPPAPANQHELAKLFPMLDEAARRRLEDDIRENGVVEPIVFLNGLILDGRNRYYAARNLGLEYPRVDYEGDDPLGFVVSRNLQRRHLTDRQRADIAATIAKLPRGSNQHRPIGQSSLAEAAALMDVPVKAVQRAKDIAEQGAPELQQAYAAGEVSPSAAAEVARLPAEQQAEIVGKGEAAAKAKELREGRKAKRAENDAAREQIAAALPSGVQQIEAHRAKARAAKADRPEERIAALEAEIAELRERAEAAEKRVAELTAELTGFADMEAAYDAGGFEAVIAGKDEVIRSQATRIERLSAENQRNLRSADWWRKQAEKLGYSRDIVIDIDEPGQAANG